MATPSRGAATWSGLPKLAAALERGKLSADRVEVAAPLLVDHRRRDLLDPLLPSRIDQVESVALLYAVGRRALVAGRMVEGRAWLTKAQSRVTRKTPEPLRARLAFELGCVLIDDGGTEAAESVAAWAESLSKRQSSDVLHLRALAAERRGHRDKAIALYRRAISAAPTALSPLSRVLELRNLAATLAHESPAEAVTMYRHALETLTAHDLDPRLAPALHNGLAYAAICAADLDLAEAELDAASRDADQLALPLMRAYALYNRSIVRELRGDTNLALSTLREARQLCEASSLRELAVWCWIRESWLALKLSDRGEADRAASSGRKISGASHAEAISTLDALFMLIDGEHLEAARIFGALAESYLSRSDLVTAFALLLWRAVAYRKANAVKGARAAARQACALRRRGPVRVSPSWWAREVIEAARMDGDAACAEDLLATGIGVLDVPKARVEVRGQEIVVAGAALTADAWQRRSGARVLRRLFAMLVAAHPHGVERDRLADSLWPESEGDKAVRNLYAATKDLRRVLDSAPGLRLVARGGGYALELDENASIVPNAGHATPRASRLAP